MTTDSRRYALIDTDPGIDDALALLLAWSSPEWTVEIITVVAGNVSMKAGTLNVFRLLELRRPSPAPLVASGAAAPLARPLRIAPYHGTDGLGDLLDWPPVELPVGAADARGVRLDLVPLDATRQAVLERAALHATLARTPGPLADGIRRFTEYALRLDEKHGRRGMDLHDPLAVGVALDPSLVEWEAVRLTIG